MLSVPRQFIFCHNQDVKNKKDVKKKRLFLFLLNSPVEYFSNGTDANSGWGVRFVDQGVD